MNEPLNQSFETVARAKLAALTAVYDRLQAEPAEPGDKALYQRQSAGKALLTHIALLRKILHLDTPAAADMAALDMTGYQTLVAEMNEGEHD